MLVFLIVPLSGVSIDIYVPALPDVGKYFHATKEFSQLSITTYLLGLGLMQLLAGSISDCFGRKKPFLWAMIFFIISTFSIPNSQNIYQLIFLRFLQGAALGMTIVPMRSVISDLFEGHELTKMMTYMTMAWSLGPIIAPAIGGHLQFYFGWKGIFYFLGIYSSMILLLAFILLFETSQYRHPFRLSLIIKRHQAMLIHKEYLNYIMIGGLLFSIINLFSIVSPFFIQTILHYSAKEFGYFTLLLGMAWFMGSMLNRFILHISLNVKAKMCFFLMLSISLLMLLICMFVPINIYNIIIPILFIFFCCGILYPSYFIQSVLLFRESTASANALFNSSAFFISGLISGLGTLIKVNTEMPFICVLIILISNCIILFFLNLLSQESIYARNVV